MDRSPTDRRRSAAYLLIGGAVLLVAGVMLSRPPARDARLARGDAILVEAGSIVRRQVAALSRDVHVVGTVLEDVVAFSGDARIDGAVSGNVLAIDGDVTVGAGAEVKGDVFAFGGLVIVSEMASVGGRTVSFPDVPGTWSLLLEGPALGLDPLSPVVVGVKLALLVTWLMVGSLLLALCSRPLRHCSEVVRAAPGRCFGIGLVVVISVALWLLLLAALLPAVVGLPILIVVLTGAVALKLWGTVAVMLAAGLVVGSRLRMRLDDLGALLVGLGLIGALKLVPWVGVVVWTTVTLIGAGAVIAARFGWGRGVPS
jgi:hypothetical protein